MISNVRRHPGLAWALGALLVVLAFDHFYLNYDSFYALVWGRDLAHGHSPDYDVLLAPTAHPLLSLFGALLSPFGDAAPGLMSAAMAISWAALIAAVFLLGSRLFGGIAGAIAALAVATSEPLASFAVRGYVDIPFLALVVGAAALEARRPRAGAPALALLSLAGLLRPEAWALAGLYWLWLWPGLSSRQRAGTALLAASAPIGWLAHDLITSGDALNSLSGTRENVQLLHRRTGLDDVPYTFARWLGYLTSVPGLIGAAGAVAAVVWLRDRARLPAAIFWAGAAVFCVYGLAGLPLISRYLTVPAVMLAVFCGAAVTGFGFLPQGRLRDLWAAARVVAALALLVFLPFQLHRLDGLRDRSAFRSRIQDDLRRLARDPAARPVLEGCRRIYLVNHRPVPILAWWLDRPPADFASAKQERPRDGALVTPATASVASAYVLDRRDPGSLRPKVPAGFRRVVGNRSWILHQRCVTTRPEA